MIQVFEMESTIRVKRKFLYETPYYDYDVDDDVESLMEVVKRIVTPSLYEALMQMLLPFSDGVQKDMAVNLLDFLMDNNLRETGYPSADEALQCCYAWIMEEVELNN